MNLNIDTTGSFAVTKLQLEEIGLQNGERVK